MRNAKKPGALSSAYSVARNETADKRLRPIGNAQQVLVAIFQAIERSEGEASLRRAVHATRSLGYKFGNAEAGKWLAPFLSVAETRSANGRFQSPGTGIGTVSERVSSTIGNGSGEPSGPARAVKVSLTKANVPSERRTPPKRSRRVKQQAMNLGEVTPPEIDYDKSRYAIPEGLPEFFPEPVDELRDVARAFVCVFGNCKREEKIRENVGKFTDTLAIFRQKGKSIAVAWKCFLDAVAAQEWAPLHGAQSKKALHYLPSGNGAFAPKTPRVDSCGCPLPAGVIMPRLKPGETAHWDGDEFLFGSESDVR